MRFLRGLMASPFWVLSAACAVVARVLVPASVADPEEDVAQPWSCSDWTEFGLVGAELLRRELEARWLPIDHEVVEVHVDIERRAVSVTCRAMLPDENASDIYRAHTAQSFALTPKLRADLAARDAARRAREQRSLMES